MLDGLRSIAGVCEVEFVCGADAARDAAPDLLLEVPHGATEASHFDDLRGQLGGDYDDGLREFFFVNTDVGAPELAVAIARGVVSAQSHRTAAVIRCLLPRTFVDCNREIDRSTVATSSQPGEMTPGLPPWVVDAADRDLLLGHYFAYREVVAAGFAAVCGQGGTALCVHTYAPRSIDVAVDDDIVVGLRAAYTPERYESWPLRAEVDLITHDPEGRELSDPEFARRVEAEFTALGFQVVRNGTYSLHPSTVAFALAQRYPRQTLCFEVRRDLLLDAFVPFVELHPSAEAVGRAAQALVAALVGGRPADA